MIYHLILEDAIYPCNGMLLEIAEKGSDIRLYGSRFYHCSLFSKVSEAYKREQENPCDGLGIGNDHVTEDVIKGIRADYPDN